MRNRFQRLGVGVQAHGGIAAAPRLFGTAIQGCNIRFRYPDPANQALCQRVTFGRCQRSLVRRRRNGGGGERLWRDVWVGRRLCVIPGSVCHLDQDYPNCHPRLRGLLSVSHDTARVSIGETCPHSGPIGPTLWYAPAPLLLCVCAVGYSARWVPVGREARVPPGASRRATSVAMSLAASGGSRFSAAGSRHCTKVPVPPLPYLAIRLPTPLFPRRYLRWPS